MWLRASLGSERRLMFVFDVLQLVSALLTLDPHFKRFVTEGCDGGMLFCMVPCYQLVSILCGPIPTTQRYQGVSINLIFCSILFQMVMLQKWLVIYIDRYVDTCDTVSLSAGLPFVVVCNTNPPPPSF